MAFSEFTERVHQEIPFTQHLQFEILSQQGSNLTMVAPLSVNANDKGSFFAGSQVTLCTLAGWSLTTLLSQRVLTEHVDVVAVRSDIHYQKPLLSDARVTAKALNYDKFKNRLMRRGKASLDISVWLKNQNGEITTAYTAVYYARR